MQRIAMISGANRGIGLSVARELAAAGYGLSLGVRNPEAMPILDCAHCLVERYDAMDPSTGQRWVDQTIACFGRLDVLVNNAGIMRNYTLFGGQDSDLDELFEVNAKAPLKLFRLVFAHLRASGSGRVVNIASLSGKRVFGPNVGYQMTKHALVALTHAIRQAGWEHGLRASALCPGNVYTEMTAGVSTMSADTMTNTEEIARLARMLIELPNSASVAELAVNCRYEALF